MAHEAAVLVLRETDNPCVMWGDESLLHMIANRAQLRCRSRGHITSGRVLNTLTRRPGVLVKGMVAIRSLRGGERLVRCFWLPEHAPKELPVANQEQLARVARGVAVLNGFWRRRDAARRDIERYKQLDADYAVIVGSDRTTAGALVKQLTNDIGSSVDEEREALRELSTALRDADQVSGERWTCWTPYDNGLSASIVVDVFDVHVTRCGPLGWRVTASMLTVPGRAQHLSTLDRFVSQEEARACAVALIYAYERKV